MRRRIVAVVLVFSLVSCTTLRPVADANTYLSNTRPSQVWVRTDRQTVMLEGPRLLGDTLVGFVDGEYREFLPGEVRGVDVRKPASGRTALLVSGMVIVGAFLIGALASTGPAGSQPTPEDDPTNPRP
jgi:hypothetical protein